MDDDNLLADYDLSAWEVPPPAAGLADAVVRRVREPASGAVRPRRSPVRWLVGAGVLAAVVAVLALVLWGIERAPADGQGVVAATSSRTLDLGRSSAVIDSGAQLTWSRHGADVRVMQARGAATWRVSAEDKLTIDATVASIEATGASLRVEVEMNRSDMRAVGIGSAAAIVVSLVTVVVYDGHVKATRNGQTVNIQPGASMQFGTPTPAPSPEQLNVGGSREDQARIRELEAEVVRLKGELAKRDKTTDDTRTPVKTTDKTTDKTTCNMVSCVLNNYEGTCCEKYEQASCDPDPLVKKGEGYLASGMDTAALAQFEKALACMPDVAISKKAFLAACRSKNGARARTHIAALPEEQRASYAQICLRFGIDLAAPAPPAPACDAAALKKKGDSYLGEGMDTAALAQFEQSLKCKFDPSVVKTAFLAACRSKQPAKAKLYYAKLPPTVASNYGQICLRYGVEVP